MLRGIHLHCDQLVVKCHGKVFIRGVQAVLMAELCVVHIEAYLRRQMAQNVEVN